MQVQGTQDIESAGTTTSNNLNVRICSLAIQSQRKVDATTWEYVLEAVFGNSGPPIQGGTATLTGAPVLLQLVDPVMQFGALQRFVAGGDGTDQASGVEVLRFADGCGAEVPRWIRLRLQSYGDDVESIKAFGLEVVTDLCDQLRTAGAPGLHFYTMNASATVLEIVRRLQG